MTTNVTDSLRKHSSASTLALMEMFNKNTSTTTTTTTSVVSMTLNDEPETPYLLSPETPQILQQHQNRKRKPQYRHSDEDESSYEATTDEDEEMEMDEEEDDSFDEEFNSSRKKQITSSPTKGIRKTRKTSGKHSSTNNSSGKRKSKSSVSSPGALSPSGKKRKEISREEIKKYFTYSQTKAAKLLGVSVSTLKRRFYSLNMGHRWPYPESKQLAKKRSISYIVSPHHRPEKQLDPHTLHALYNAFAQHKQPQAQSPTPIQQ